MNICIRKCVSLNANACSHLGGSDCAFTYFSLHTESQCTTAETAFDISVTFTRVAEFQKGTNVCFPRGILFIICFHRSVSRGPSSGVLGCSECVGGVCVYSARIVCAAGFLDYNNQAGKKKKKRFILIDKLNSARLPLCLLFFVFCLLVPSGNE